MSNGGEGRAAVVGAVVNAVAILRRLAVQTEPSGVNAIARASGVSPSSCFNILKTLVLEDLVEFDPVAKTYAPGRGLGALVPQEADAQTAFPRCAPLLEDLAERHGATIALWRLTPSERLVLLGFAESPSATRIHMTVGQRLPMLLGAGGRCIAAALDLPNEAIAQRYEQLRWENAPSLAAFLREISEVRARGWALDDGNFLNGVTTLSAAVINTAGRPAYVVGATFFRGQHGPSRLAQIGSDLKSLAPRVAKALSA